MMRLMGYLDCEMSNSIDTLQELPAGFVSMVWSTASESTVLVFLHLIWPDHRGACGVMRIVVGNGHGDTRLNAGRG